MVRPVREVATAIEEQDLKALSALPGIGPATSERIVAKLRRRMPKFALLVSRDEPTAADVAHDVVSETFEALRTLGHSESDARRLIDAALETKKKYKDVQEMINVVYQQQRDGARESRSEQGSSKETAKVGVQPSGCRALGTAYRATA